MGLADDVNAEGRRLAEQNAAIDRANRPAPQRGGADRFWGLLNGWTMIALMLGFTAGILVEHTLIAAFTAAICFGLAALALQFVLMALGVVASAGAAGLSGLNRGLGSLPLWLLIGAALGAAAGAGIAIWLDGDNTDITEPALRLAPWGAGLGVAFRLIGLAFRKSGSGAER